MLSKQGLRKVLSWHQANLICTLHHIRLVCSCSGSFIIVKRGYKDVYQIFSTWTVLSVVKNTDKFECTHGFDFK